ncbi:putative proline-rich receptor-like protein kinase PERK6 [Hevea brasiliensis]|uniref:putative proline-rich receptor-like protein kinase PERK6 n=1 Tax=Hevea brasiliensis TaxID=3981 RepID=UPI0025F3A8F9|nr:putative proline-rich receptor-like protein kinase PERK6 [Hevea brasiliensis]
MFKGDSVEINYSCLVDSALKGDYIKSEMELMIYCAAVSVYRPSKLRPRMKQIVEALEGKLPSNELWVAEEKTGSMAGQKKGSIAFFATYKPPVPLDIFSCPVLQTSRHDELHMTDGLSYNYN